MIVPAMAPSLAHDQTDEQADASSGSHLAWLRAEEERAALRRTWAEWFAGHDLLLLPVMTVAAFPHDHDPDMFGRTIEIDGDQRSLVSTIDWLGLIGIVGLPSAVVPIGRTAAGLPVGHADRGPVPARPAGGAGGPAGRRRSSAATRSRPASDAELLMWGHQPQTRGRRMGADR